jgi:hypothetical protein
VVLRNLTACYIVARSQKRRRTRYNAGDFPYEEEESKLPPTEMQDLHFCKTLLLDLLSRNAHLEVEKEQNTIERKLVSRHKSKHRVP